MRICGVHAPDHLRGLVRFLAASAVVLTSLPFAQAAQVATPTFSPVAGTYTATQSITVSTTTNGASIRYTTDGTTPSRTVGTLYSTPVTVSSTTTIKAIGYKTTGNFTDSAIATGVFTITGTVANPTFSPVAGTYASAQSVAISTTTGGASIRYTTDGSTPSPTVGTVYSGAVSVSSTMTLKAIAYETGWTSSAVTSAGYTIGNSLSFNTAATFTAQSNTTTNYTFAGTAGQVVSTEIANWSGQINLYILKPDGSTLASNWASGSGATVYISGVYLPSTGTYTLQIVQSAGTSGTATLSLISNTTSSTISANTPVAIPLTATASAEVAYTFTGTTGQVVSAEIANWSGRFDLLILKPDGTTLTSTWSTGTGGTEYLSGVALPSNGTYTVLAVPYTGTTGPATLSLTSNTASPTISFGSPVTSTFNASADATAAYVFSGVAAQAVNASVTGWNGRVDVSIVGPNGSTIGSTWGTSGTVTLQGAVLPSGGTYSFLVVPYTSTSGTATISLFTNVSNPTFSPAAGTYPTAQSITINTTSGASIRYTTDGSTPSPTVGTVYSGPFDVSATKTIKAIGYETGWTSSAVSSATYTITGTVANPTISLPSGSYPSAQSLTISTTTSGASIRYTTDGTMPSATAGTIYSGPVNVAASMTLNAIAYETGWTSSALVSAAYSITPPAGSIGLAQPSQNNSATISGSRNFDNLAVSKAFGSNNIAGNTILVVVGVSLYTGGASDGTISLSDSNGNSYTLLYDSGAAHYPGPPRVLVYGATNIANGANTVGFTDAGVGNSTSSWSANAGINIFELTGFSSPSLISGGFISGNGGTTITLNDSLGTSVSTIASSAGYPYPFISYQSGFAVADLFSFGTNMFIAVYVNTASVPNPPTVSPSNYMTYSQTSAISTNINMNVFFQSLPLMTQTPKEYIRIGGSVIAIENNR